MMFAIVRHPPIVDDDAAAATLAADKKIAMTLLLSLFGLFTAAFFLSRTYLIVLYFLGALVVAEYAGASNRIPFADVPDRARHAAPDHDGDRRHLRSFRRRSRAFMISRVAWWLQLDRASATRQRDRSCAMRFHAGNNADASCLFRVTLVRIFPAAAKDVA